MLFISLSNKDRASYSYMTGKLKEMIFNLRTARSTLENLANASFDKAFAKCIYQLTSESLQCENELMSQVNTLSGDPHYVSTLQAQKEKHISDAKISNMDALCNYFENCYIGTYKKILKEDFLGSSLTNLIQNQLKLFASGLTQLRMFSDVRTTMN